MATMYPADITFYKHTKSERVFYNALKQQLPERIAVFFSVVWYQNVDGVRENSEADFVIFDPHFGFISIEVKGGKGIEKIGNEWRLIESIGLDEDSVNDMEAGKTAYRVLKRSPFIQAEASMRFFKQYYEDNYNQRFSGLFGYASAFPFYNIDQDFGPDGPLDLVIDFNDMNRLNERVNELFHYWKGHRKDFVFMSLDSQTNFKDILLRRMAVAEITGAVLIEQYKRFAEVNRIQNNYLELLTNYRQTFIVGGAGTGKTFLALLKARQLAAAGLEVLLVCFNNPLAKFLQEQTSTWKTINIYTVWGLFKNALGDEKFQQLVNNNSNLEGIFDKIDQLDHRKKYDAIIVDEAQDFLEEWALSIRLFLSNEAEDYLYVFYDEDQNIFGRQFGQAFLINYPPFVLCENLRNTAEIHDWVVQETGMGHVSRTNMMHGLSPQKFTFTRAREARNKVGALLNALTIKEMVPNSSIVVLSNRTLANSFLKGDKHCGAMILHEDYENISGSNVIQYRTVQSFKGLEADVVIYLHHRQLFDFQAESMQKYVAGTRARYVLYVIEYQETE